MKMRMTIALLLLTATQLVTMADTSFTAIGEIEDSSLKAKMEDNVSKMLTAFQDATDQQAKAPKLSKDNLTSGAIEEVKQIWKTSAMSSPSSKQQGRFLKTPSGYQVRGIPVDVAEAANEEKRQELTIDFQSDGKISSVSIAIDNKRYDEIMAEKSSDTDYSRRQIIVDFVENFRTAYNRKDLKLITSVFSDKALILTGRVVMERPNTDVDRMTMQPSKVVYIKQSKQEYIASLAQEFKATKYLNVTFDDIEVVQHPKYDDVYGVTLRQNWYTDKNQDEGYLFLMIDFRDNDTPMIQVRTWQPIKDSAGRVVTERKDVFHLGSFRIVR